jgi:hypothetical protein
MDFRSYYPPQFLEEPEAEKVYFMASKDGKDL